MRHTRCFYNDSRTHMTSMADHPYGWLITHRVMQPLNAGGCAVTTFFLKDDQKEMDPISLIMHPDQKEM